MILRASISLTLLFFLLAGVSPAYGNLRITSYVWKKDGRLEKVTRPNGTVREIKYDAAGRPDVIEEYGPGMKLIFVHKHGYYPSDEMQWRYELPAKRTSGNDPPPMSAMTYNADNQLATWGGMAVTHDADGNMTSGPNPAGASLATYSYDARNRLTAAIGTSYTYDADGQRVGMAQDAVTTTFAVDVGSELSKVLVRTKNGIPTRYVWGLGLLYEVNGTGGSATTASYHHDATGSTIALTDDTATVIERIGYTPWGQINHRINLSGTPLDTPFLFTGFFGNQTDDNGLLYMRNRYYHPLIGRFLNADPAQEGMNWFAYGGGNPIGMVDPMGLGITGAINAVQKTLSFLGMIPVFGAVFDVVNAGISIGRGNYVDAGFNLASAIPGIGDFAAGAKLIGAGAAYYGGARLLNNAGYRIGSSTNAGGFTISRLPVSMPTAGGTGYRSFSAFKRTEGSPIPGSAWHHVVEKRNTQFIPYSIHSTSNLVQVPIPIHNQISAHYSLKFLFTNGKTVRDWLKGQSFASQKTFGINILRKHGVIP